MREIKFRAWDGETFLYIDLNNIEDKVSLDYLELFLKCDKQQYTGLKDKKGKGIYEGDIVKQIFNGFTAVVEWNPFPKMAGWQVDHFGIDIFDFNSIEVIGNIYENEDLLCTNK